ncbi:MAG: hypothetical protein H7Z41_01365, partial [Cytophagales bacterium]|nr:hypothetical protein [Armatimonadota bacterium]
VLLFWPLIFGQKALFFGDISLYFTPLLQFQRGELLSQGRIPLWNPTILCGTPFVGNPQSWPFYPSSLLLHGLPAWKAVGVIGAIHLIWAGAGTFCFLRARSRSRVAALLGALAWALGGALVSKMQFPNMVQAASWLPWLLLTAENVLQRPSMTRAGLFGSAVGLSLLAAHAQMFLLQFYLVVAWGGWRLCGTGGGRARLLCLAGGLTLGAGLAAAQLLPTLEMVGLSVRPDLPLEKANRFILPAYALVTNFLAPNFYGNPADPDNPYFGRGNFWEACSYQGLLPFTLALLAAARCLKAGDVRFWGAVVFFGLWLAVGRDAGLFTLAFRALPGLNRFHDAARFLQLATFAIACLAAFGLDTVMERGNARIRMGVASITLALTAVDLAWFAHSLNPLIDEAEFTTAIRAAPAGRGTGRLFHADEGRVWGAFVSYRSYELTANQRERSAFLRSLAPNLSTIAGWRDASGYEPVRLSTLERPLSALKHAARHSSLPRHERLLDALAVGTVVRWDQREKRPEIRRRAERSWDARAQLWTQFQTASDDIAAADSVTKPSWGGIPFIAPEPGLPPLAAAGDATPTRLVVHEAGPDSLALLLPPGHSAGLVVLADAAYPGWEALVDGKPASTVLVNGAFRGVFVPVSARVVHWKYEPTTVRLGLFLSLLSAGILTVMFASVAAAKVVCRASGRRDAAVSVLLPFPKPAALEPPRYP